MVVGANEGAALFADQLARDRGASPHALAYRRASSFGLHSGGRCEQAHFTLTTISGSTSLAGRGRRRASQQRRREVAAKPVHGCLESLHQLSTPPVINTEYRSEGIARQQLSTLPLDHKSGWSIRPQEHQGLFRHARKRGAI